MYALLIVNENGRDLQIMVRVQARGMRERVVALLQDNQGREAFELLKNRAEVQAYIPQGVRPEISPAFTLVEEML
jgi:hypothetical protein